MSWLTFQDHTAPLETPLTWSCIDCYDTHTDPWSIRHDEDCPHARNGQPHVIPVNDMIEHLPDGCPCGPTDMAVKRDDGSMDWTIVHHSLDGREHRQHNQEQTS